jgi:Cu(I)/Ag(I) efflux system membrane fusion protein/cobalt-zinc-cadmium efflux system membrane fusion protein
MKIFGLIVIVVALGAGLGGGLFLANHLHERSAQPVSMVHQATGPAKQLWHCGMHPWVIQDHPGDCPVCHMKLTPMHTDEPGGASAGQKKLLYYWDPMLGPSSISDKPGKSAMGMELVPVYAEAAGPRVTIDPTIVQNMGVRIAAVTRGPLKMTVRAVGMLQTPDPGLYDVSLKIGGWIDKLDANQDGMHVVKGQTLFELYSPDLHVAEEELISAMKADQSLGTDAAPALRQDAGKLVDSAKRKLRLWDVAEVDIETIAKATTAPKDVPFRSPATGHIVEKVVVQGTAVQPGMRLMRIEDHTQIWLDAQVYEEQLSMVKIGQEVLATIDGVPGKTFKGTITFMYPHLDHMTRTLTVRMTLDNPEFELRPGMYATANIQTRPLDDAIQVPREAVIDTGTRQIAFVSEGEGHYAPRMVRMGIAGDNDRVQIVEGLAPGETVVTSGQFLMDVESRTTEAIEKLRRSESNSTTMPAGERAGSRAGDETDTTQALALLRSLPLGEAGGIGGCPRAGWGFGKSSESLSTAKSLAIPPLPGGEGTGEALQRRIAPGEAS